MIAEILARMSSKIQLKRVEFIPKALDEGILYVSQRFKVAAHLCPCGCSTKIVTPLGPCEWSFSEKKAKPTLYPSIGNWQIPCRSHYWIKSGQIEWSYPWPEEKIQTERNEEQARRELYYQKKANYGKTSLWKRIKSSILNILNEQ
jgi:hypothetical protein